MSSSDEEDVALSQITKNNGNGKTRKRRMVPDSDPDSDSDYNEDTPIAQLNGKSKVKPAPKKQKTTEKKTAEKKISAKKASTPRKAKKATVKKEAVKKETTAKTTVKKEPKKKSIEIPITPPTSNGSRAKSEESVKNEDEEEEEEDESYKWWEREEDLDGEVKWETLEHKGVLFPPPYEPLPSHVKLYYDGKPVEMPLEAEEVAGFYGAMLETDHAKNPVFQKNFFNDFLDVLKESGGCTNGVVIKEFDKLDFSKMFHYYEQQREAKKLMTRDEKKQIKLEKEKLEEPYKFCYLNGRKEQVGNFRIEPPGLFRGRGAHPKTGKLKRRVYPESVTLNLSENAPVPEPPMGHQWGGIQHLNTVTWLAMWKENIADLIKYVRLAQNSSLKGLSDFKKFETARKLKDHIEPIRKDYRKMLKDELMLNRQMATATYLIDVFALRAGGEKGDDEADTVGCCSLRFEHVTLKPPNIVIFDFLGKDSIRFYQEVEVDKQVFKNLRIFKKAPKRPGDDLFDRITPTLLNKHLQNYMTGLTAKVFRTYNASKTMQDQLDLIANEGTVAEKVMKFNAANRTVAILCNHQRTVSKNHSTSVEKITFKLKEMMWQKIRLKRILLELEPELKKKDKHYFSEIDDLAKEDIMQIHEVIIERQREQVFKKLARDNEKLKAEGQPLLTEDSVKEKLEKIEELKQEYAEELKTGKPEVKSNMTVEKLKKQIEVIETRVLNTEVQLKDKEDNSEVSLGTSKMNYIDPRLTVMFAKKFEVPIEKLFTKTLRDKFKWAIESADENWRF